MADDYSSYDWGNAPYQDYGGGATTQELDPEQFLRQGGYSAPVDLASINTMASGAPSGSTNYGVGPDASLGNTPQTVTAMPGGAGAGGGSGTPRPGSGNNMNLMRMLALAGAGGAGLAGLVTSNSSPTLPSQVQTALKQAQTGTGPQDPNAAYRYDLARAQQAKKLSSEMGPGYATSTPGIQAQQELERTINQDVYQRQLGQQQIGLGTVNALTGPLMQRQSSNTQGLMGLAGLLGTLGMYGGYNPSNPVYNT